VVQIIHLQGSVSVGTGSLWAEDIKTVLKSDCVHNQVLTCSYMVSVLEKLSYSICLI